MPPTEFDRRHTGHSLALAKLQTRAEGQHPLITGYAAVFYRGADPGTQYTLWDNVVERIDPHAFDVAIREDDVVALFNHNPDHLLGRNRAGTLKLSVDEWGLRYEIDPPATQIAKQVSVAIERGDLRGSSFAFEIVGEEISREGDLVVRTIKQVRLWDVGPVTYPAYGASSTELSQRSRDSLSRHVQPTDLLRLRQRQIELLRRETDAKFHHRPIG